MTIQSDIALAPLTTFRVGGRAARFADIKYPTDLDEAARFAREESARRGAALPVAILGEGSNTLVSDQGFDGLVVRMSLRGIKTREVDWDTVELSAMAGERWDDVVAYAVSRGWRGIENLSGIPGTVGAAPVQNIGAYGAEAAETISSVEAYDLDAAIRGENAPIRSFSNAECRFGYRDSIFKQKGNERLIIVRVAFLLKKSGKANIGYKDLKERFKDRYSSDVSLAELREAVLDIRAKKLPDPRVLGTAGSFFKNPVISAERYAALKESWPGMPGFADQGGAVKVPLAWILDKVCGLSGWKSADGAVGCYPTQPIALVNYGGATEASVRSAADHIAALVREKTGIEVEWEVRRLG